MKICPAATGGSGARVDRPQRNGEVWEGLRHALPAVLAAVPIGVAFGIVVSQSPLAWWWAPVFATVIFAGSLEFLVLGMVVAVAPLGAIAATAFLVNFRHVFYALSFPLHRVHGRWAKVYSTFTLTDEAWALTTSPDAQHWSRRRILAIQASFQVAWVVAVTFGALAGTLIPPAVVGLNFAVTAFFLVLAIDAFKAQRNVPIPLIALVCALGAHLIAGDGMLVVAMTAFVVILLARYALLRHRPARTESTDA